MWFFFNHILPFSLGDLAIEFPFRWLFRRPCNPWSSTTRARRSPTTSGCTPATAYRSSGAPNGRQIPSRWRISHPPAMEASSQSPSPSSQAETAVRVWVARNAVWACATGDYHHILVMSNRYNSDMLVSHLPIPSLPGQFACPSRQLLKGAKGIHFQSEAESMEPADCEDRCGGVRLNVSHLLYQFSSVWWATYFLLCMYIYIDTYIHTYIHTYLPTYLPTYVRTYVRTLHT